MLARLLPHPTLTVLVIIAWMLLANSASPGALVMGIIIGILVPQFSARFWVTHLRFRRPGVLVTFVPLVLWDIVAANLVVGWITLTRPNSSLRPAFVRVPLDIQDEYGIVALASIITLTPGTISAQLDTDRGAIHVHALDCPDPDELVQSIKLRYEQPLRELLE